MKKILKKILIDKTGNTFRSDFLHYKETANKETTICDPIVCYLGFLTLIFNTQIIQ